MSFLLPSGQHYGRTTCVLDCFGCGAAEVIYPAGLKTPLHANRDTLLVFVDKGHYSKKIDRSLEMDCCDGDILLIPAEHSQADTFGRVETRCLVIDLKREWFERRDLLGILREPLRLRRFAVRFNRTLTREFRHADSLSPLVIEGTVLETIALLQRNGQRRSQPHHWLPRLESLLRERFREQLRSTDIAGEFGLHRSQLAREFRLAFGMTLGEYVRTLRIEAAARLLEQDMPLSAIALVVGFYDQAHFSNAFKTVTGFTPSSYRDRLSRLSKTPDSSKTRSAGSV